MKTSFTRLALISLIIFENLFLFCFFQCGVLTQGKNAAGYFLSSLFFGIILLFRFFGVPAVKRKLPTVQKSAASYVLIAILSAAWVGLGVGYAALLRSRPIDPKSSDIIPLIQVMTRRALTGQYPYTVFNDFGYTFQPTYLPMHWGPFCLAEVFHFDYRWVSFAAFTACAAYLTIRVSKNTRRLAFTSIMLLFIALLMFMGRNASILANTVELLIAGYYMLVICALNSNNWLAQGVCIALCLLSRYSLILWLPLYACVLFQTGKRTQLALAASVIVLMVMGIFVVPFWSHDWSLIAKIYRYYDVATFSEWSNGAPDNKPCQLFQGTGFAYHFFTRYTGISITDRISLVVHIHFFACAIAVALLMGWYMINRRKINDRIFLMGSLKIYMSIFLFLIQIPYPYLMITGNLMSLAIFCEVLQLEDGPGNPKSLKLSTLPAET